MPATFIVLMSFISLVLDRNACAARVSLGVTTVLTITTLMHSAKSNLPHTSYPKVIIQSYIFVFRSHYELFFSLALIHKIITHFLSQAMGIFLEGCFLFTFVTLMEYSITSYLQRKRTAFLARNKDMNNFLLDIPIPVPVSLKERRNTTEPSFGIKGQCEIEYPTIQSEHLKYVQIVLAN